MATLTMNPSMLQALFVRSDRAAIPKSMSAYYLARSPSHMSIMGNCIKRCVDITKELPNYYTLKDLLKFKDTGENFRADEAAVLRFVEKSLGSDHEVIGSQQLLLEPKVTTLPTTTVRLPDGSVCLGNATVFVYEVESNASWVSTTLKLSMHLCQQLASLRNRQFHVGFAPLSIAGFYFPRTKKECVLKVTVTWNDNHFKFEETHEVVEQEDVSKTLKSTFEKQYDLWNTSTSTVIEGLNYPVSRKFLVTEFGKDAEQIDSCHSIIILSVSSRRVYKRCFTSEASGRLNDLRGMTLNGVAFPLMELKFVQATSLFQYDLYEPPPTPDVIMKCAIWFTKSVVALVESLHSISIAHLDIRRDNLCLSQAGDSLVLIDLDRSASVDEPAIEVANMYVGAEMYKAKDGWTNRNLDWKQVGMLLKGTLEGCEEHPFVSGLINKGVLDKSLLDTFCQDLIG